MVRKDLSYPRLLTHDGPTTIAAHEIVGLQAPAAATSALCDKDADATIVLAHLRRAPAVQSLHAREFTDPPAQDALRRILRQPLIVGEIEWADQLALHPVVAVGAEQRPVGREPADAVLTRNG